MDQAGFYGQSLDAQTMATWDRRTARGCRPDLHGLRLEILHNRRQGTPAQLHGQSNAPTR
jgi:hypothetical protein